MRTDVDVDVEIFHICRSETLTMGNSWVREFRDGTAQTPGSVTPQQDSKVGAFTSVLSQIFPSNSILAANIRPDAWFPPRPSAPGPECLSRGDGGRPAAALGEELLC